MADITMPQLGETVTEGMITRWFKQIGESVAVDEVLYEVSTDKVDTEVTSPAAGVLSEILANEGDTVQVGQVLARVGIAEDSRPDDGAHALGPSASASGPVAPARSPSVPGSSTSAPSPSASGPSVFPRAAGPAPVARAAPSPASAGSSASPDSAGKAVIKPSMLLSPIVRRLLADNNLDPSEISGTGIGGRITRSDAEKAIRARATASPAETSKSASAERSGSALVKGPSYAPAEGPSSTPADRPAPIDGSSSAAAQRSSSTPAQRPMSASAERPAPIERSSSTPAQRPMSASAERLAPIERSISASAEGPMSAPVEGAKDGGAETLEGKSIRMPPSQSPLVGQAQASAGMRGDQVVPLNNIRKRTADHMVMSKRVSPHVLTAVEVDFEAVEQVRRSVRSEWKAEEGFGLSYLPFIARAVIDALREFPYLNASVDNEKLIVHRSVNLAIAVDLDFQGLLAPVIPGAEGKRLRQIARDIVDVASRARRRRLKPDDLSFGTFTLTNVGQYGTMMQFPIINQPQVAILSTDGISRKPVVVTDSHGVEAIAIHSVGVLAMAWDHRAFDGVYAAAFLQRVRQIIERRDWATEVI